MPNSPERALMAGCTTCHTVQRIVASSYTTDQFMALIPRMMRYGAMSRPNHPQVAADRQPTNEPKDEVLRKLAGYYASINHSTGSPAYALHTAPRPSGRATRVIMTEYELPRPDLTEPHDVLLDAQGTVWYSDFGGLGLGKLNPATGQVTEYKLPELKPGAPVGQLDLELDPQGNPWVAMMYQAAVAKLDKTTGKVQVFKLPPEFDNPRVQIGMLIRGIPTSTARYGSTTVGRRPSSGSTPHRARSRLSIRSRIFRSRPGIPPTASPPSRTEQSLVHGLRRPQHRAHRQGGHHATLSGDAQHVPAAPRPHERGRPHLAFAEFAADKVGIIDTKTEQIREWPLSTNFAPYDAVLDHNGEIWSGGMNADQVVRIDTATGRSVGYLLPQPTNIRRVFVDNTTTPVTFWTGNNHHGSIVKLEPLD